jgi:LacI family transcriptional regulator
LIKNINLKQLAEILNLSQTTISRALNGFPEVSSRTRKLVIDAAAEHNYQPNTRAKRLATGKSLTIGHLVSVSKEHEMVNPIFSDFIAGASVRYAESGYDLLLSLVPDEDEFTAYKELAARSAVDGVVVHAPRVSERRIALLNELNLPFVVHGRSSEAVEDYNWVDVNNERSFFRATQFLIDLGHQTIALINGVADMDFAMRRSLGFRRALSKNNIYISDDYTFNGEMTEPYGYRSTLVLLELPRPPTAIITSSIIVANGIRRALEDNGLKLGRDISVITHDDDLSYFRDTATVPVYTATRSSVREAGRISADLLIKTIEDPTRAKEGILLDSELIVGSSTKPPKP